MNNYNLNLIKEMTDGDQGFMKEMAATFVEEMSEDVRAMNEAVDNGNAALTYQIVHKMKPNLQLFGLELATEVEHLENWSEDQMDRERILFSAKMVTDAVLKAISELKADFKI